MKCVLEFGKRGGMHTENVVLPTRKLGRQLATALQATFTNNPDTSPWELRKDVPRITWQNDKYYIALSLLDDFERGPASAYLWRKAGGVK